MRASASLTRQLAIFARRAAPWRWPKPALRASWLALPHGRPQHVPQLVFDLGDAVGVGLPGGPGGGERRLEVGELGGGLGAPVGSVGEVAGEIVAALLELVSVRRRASRERPRPARRAGSGVGIWWARSRRWVTAGMSARSWASTASRTSRASARSCVLGDDVDAVLVAAAGGADVQAAVGGGGGDEVDADVDGVGLVAVLGGGVAEPDMLPRRSRRGG